MPEITYKGYTFDIGDGNTPIALVTPASQCTVTGALVKVDGRASFDPKGNGLTYNWSFSQIPIGSQVEVEGFESVDPDNAVVTFAPDIIGIYEVELVVDDGSLLSAPAVSRVEVRVLIVPNNEGIVPDAGWIWSYLSDFWKLVEDRDRFEVFWSASIQIVAAEMLKLWQVDYNKSIADIQEVFQRRWLNYSPKLTLDSEQCTGILADETAGLDASTNLIDEDTCTIKAQQPDFFDVVTIPNTEGSLSTTAYGDPILAGRVIDTVGRCFTKLRDSSNRRFAINVGSDGGTTSLSDSFTGSGFDASYVGFELRILNGADRGTYLISGFTDSTTISVSLLTTGNPPASFNETASNLSYSICPAESNVNSLFADRRVVPTGETGQPWRMLPTMITTEFDLEQEGVSPGDVLEVEILREDLNLTTTFALQIVCADRGRIGFTYNRVDLEDGIVFGRITEEDQEAIAEALQVTGLTRDINGVLQYTLESLQVKNRLESVSFKRTYFETVIDEDTSIDVNAFTFRIKPLRIIRNTKIGVDADIVSVPVLQEYIRQPDIANQDGQLFVVGRDSSLTEIDHEPYVLVENLDYIIDDESMITGTCNLIANVNEIEIPRGDLIDRNVGPGDTIEVSIGATSQLYDIREVLSSTKLRVSPTPSTTESGVGFFLSRTVPGKFIRFVRDVFTKESACPSSLWAELTYFSNDENIENNFGVLVGIRREDIERREISTPYRNVVAGLMYALTTGPTIANLRLSAQILLGLPFAINQGVVTEINPSYRIREDGSPLFGRILVEARNDDGESTGITNIYFYPQGRQLEDPSSPTGWTSATPDEAGLAINPVTGVEYQVGDDVAEFAVLSKGVEVSDYLNDPASIDRLVEQGTLTALLTQYHSFSLSINTDLIGTANIDLVGEFIQKVKPSHTQLSPSLLKFFEDIVDIEDNIIFTRPFSFFSTPVFGLPMAVKFDAATGDDDVLTVEGVMYNAYLFGTDLSTTQGSNQVESATGGFVTAGAGFSYDTPFLRTGDLLVIEEGSNAGQYEASTIDSDTQLTVVFAGQFETLTDQKFKVYRPVKNTIFSGSMAVTNGNPTVSTPAGIFSAGVTPGDILTLHGGGVNASRIYTIIEVRPSLQEIDVEPQIEEATASYTGNIWREGLLTEYLINAPTDNPHTVDLTIGSPQIVFQAGSSDLDQLGFIRPGDEVIIDSSGVVHIVVDFEPGALTAHVYPSPTVTSAGEIARIRRPTRQLSPISTDILLRIPSELFFIEFQLPGGNQDLTTTALSPTVGTVSGEDFDALGVKPGDFLVVLGGADSSIDVGYGAGVYPILDLPSTTTLTLTRNLTVTNGAPGVRYGIRRREVS